MEMAHVWADDTLDLDWVPLKPQVRAKGHVA
jgi:hypothetical protein